MGTSVVRTLLLFLVAGAALASGAFGQSNEQSPVGVHLRELRYWGSAIFSVDFMRRAGNGSGGIWLTRRDGTWNTGEQAALDLDAQGWPRSLPAADSSAQYRYVTTILVMMSAHRDKYPAGRYTVIYDGEGELVYGGDAVLNAADSQPGREAVDVTASTGFFTLSIRATDPKRNGNYLRNVRVVAPGGTCNDDPTQYALDASECPASFQPFTATYATRPFHPLFLKDFKPFSVIRFMNFTNTVESQVSRWSERPQLDAASWATVAGAPFEVGIDLANALNASPWLTVPAKADDDYVTQFARLAKARLSTRRPIYVEYHNEAWNGAAPYSTVNDWIQAQADARWSGGDANARRMNWYGMRADQVCRLWKQEFVDEPGRVKCVMGGQSGNSWISDQALACALHAAEPGVGHNCAQQMDALAIGPYFGGYISQAPYQATVSNWLQEADGGLNKLFEEVNTGLLLRRYSNTQPWAALAQTYEGIAGNKAIAGKYGLPLVTYEGGQEMTAGGPEPFRTNVQALFANANRDPRMRTAYADLYANWKAAGGELFVIHESTGDYSIRRGNSPLLEYQGQPRATAPKYDATLAFIEANPCWWSGCVVPATPPALAAGWNLFGNGMETPVEVASLFGNPLQVQSVWKWQRAGASAGWAFYTPMLADGGAAYAASRGFAFLQTIAPGEGFWVNARTAFDVALPGTLPVASSSFQPASAGGLPGGRRALASGWSLIAVGDRPMPADFDSALGSTPPAPGVVAGNVISLWSWSPTQKKWRFWAPSLVKVGGLAAYNVSKGYLDLGEISPSTGLWVSRP